jgi:hypothetical protein
MLKPIAASVNQTTAPKEMDHQGGNIQAMPRETSRCITPHHAVGDAVTTNNLEAGITKVRNQHKLADYRRHPRI